MEREWFENCIVCNSRLYYIYEGEEAVAVERECGVDCPYYQGDFWEETKSEKRRKEGES